VDPVAGEMPVDGQELRRILASVRLDAEVIDGEATRNGQGLVELSDLREKESEPCAESAAA
jgi:hypothetical protein